MSKKKTENNVLKILTICLIVLFFAIPIVDGLTGSFYGAKTLSLRLIIFVLCFFYILALVDGLMKHKDKKRRIFICFVTIGNASISLLHLFTDISVIIAFIVYNTILDWYYIFYNFLDRTQYPNGEKADFTVCTTMAMVLPWMLCLFGLSIVTYLNQMLLLLYSLIVTGGLVAIFTVLSLTVFKKTYVTFTKKASMRVRAFVGIVFLLFVYSCFVTSAINNEFPSEKYTASYEIVDKKKLYSGRMYGTTYNLYIMFNEKKVPIEVSSDLYEEKEIGENLAVDYCSGFLNIPYLVIGE